MSETPTKDIEEFGDGEGEHDPRVQEELERLNKAGGEINELETKLTQARNDYRSTLQMISHELKQMERRLGSCVKKARPYYESRSKYRVALNQAQRATENFEHAVSRHTAAREMVAVAEASLESSVGARPEEKLAWAEMLNSATEKVNSAESERHRAFFEHTEKLKAFQIIERNMNALQKSLKRNILASKPYFEQKSEKMKKVEERRNTVTDIEQRLSISKSDYQAALRTLETISEQIHLQRKLQRLEINSLQVPGSATGNGENENNQNIGDTTSFRSVLSDLNRVDSIEHIDNLSDPSDVDGADRLSVDSGLWTPGSGGSRNGSGRLRIPRPGLQPNGVGSSHTVDDPARIPGPSNRSSSSGHSPSSSKQSSSSIPEVPHHSSSGEPEHHPFADTRTTRVTVRKKEVNETTPTHTPEQSKMVSLDVRKLSSDL